MRPNRSGFWDEVASPKQVNEGEKAYPTSINVIEGVT